MFKCPSLSPSLTHSLTHSLKTFFHSTDLLAGEHLVVLVEEGHDRLPRHVSGRLQVLRLDLSLLLLERLELLRLHLHAFFFGAGDEGGADRGALAELLALRPELLQARHYFWVVRHHALVQVRHALECWYVNSSD